MSDLLDEPTPGQNAPEFSVSEISGEIKKTLEGSFGRVRVRGEVGRVFKARSGHLYYDIKDDKSVLACTTWKGQVAGLSVVPEEGLEVVVTGRLTAFGAQSKYNMNVEEVAVAGKGALMALLEKRKAQLQAEGLFATDRKKPLPFLPQVIGVVTSPSGAVIRDILHRLRDRFPRKVLVWPVAVQGQNCASEVARAIKGFNQMSPGGSLPRPDLIIVARGGGAIEDLWGFNEEIVARATADSDIPLISAVGHETDTTLIDYVSDLRAPTPTAAAEHAVPVRLELLAWSESQGGRMTQAATRMISMRRQRLDDLSRALPRAESLLDTPRQRLDRTADRLPSALIAGVQRRRIVVSERTASLRPAVLRSMVETRANGLRNLGSRLSVRPIQRDMDQKRKRLSDLLRRLDVAQRSQNEQRRRAIAAAGRQLDILSYKSTLARGYAVVRSDGGLVTSQEQAAKATDLSIEFADGVYDLDTAAPAPKRGSKTGKPPKADPEGQGSLF